MKIVFAFLFVLYSVNAYSHIVLTGNGKGSVTQTDMSGLQAGDTLAIRAGHYEKGGSFKNLTGITIINYNGIVYFGNTVTLGNLSIVAFSGNGSSNVLYGFHFQDVKADAFLLEAPCNNFTIAYCEYRNLDGTVFNASRFFTTYTGEDSTFALYKTYFRYQFLVHSGSLFTGSWAANSLFQNVVDSISFINIVIDSTSSDVCQVIGHSIYRMLASHWKITGPCPNGKHDAGIFQTFGNGTVCNVYRKGGWGYLWRSWNLALNGHADSYMYNCIDLSTDNYGTIDTRIDAEDTTKSELRPFIRGASMHVLNNTIGNKKTINYVSELVIAGNYYPENGYVLEVRNNLCFNTVATGFDPVIKQNTGNPLKDTSNNIYCTDPIASGILLDTIFCYLDSNGYAIDKAIVFPFIRVDIDGITRPTGQSSDIGAREYPEIRKTPYSSRGSLPKYLFFLGATTLAGAALVLAFRYRKKGKVKKSRYLFHQEQERRINFSNLSSH
jgi:hypothetical protein